MRVHVCDVCVGDQSLTLGACFSRSILYISIPGLTELKGSHRLEASNWLAKCLGSAHLCTLLLPQRTRITDAFPVPEFYKGAADLNLIPSAYAASTLPTEISQLLFAVLQTDIFL